MDQELSRRRHVYSCGWDLTHSCNYRCTYCFFIPSWTHDAERTNTRHEVCSPQDWIAFWERLKARYGEFYVEVAGGEPFSHPRAAELLSAVSGLHRLRVVTNLSAPVTVLERFDPGRLSYSASYHPQLADEAVFLAKLERLKDAGFEVMASVVAHPSVFAQLQGLCERFSRRGVELYINPFQGSFAGRGYPDAYTSAERDWLCRHTDELARHYRLRDESPFGRACAAGRRYFRLWPDGTIHRCCPVTEMGLAPLGRITDSDFRLDEEDAPCPARVCFAPNEIVLLAA